MIERDNLYELLRDRALEEGVGVRPHNAECLAGNTHRFDVLDSEIVVIDSIGSKVELGRERFELRLKSKLCGGGCGLLTHDIDEPLRRRLDRSLVDIAADPATAELLRDRRGSA